MAAVVAQAIAATCAVVDPSLFILGGPVGGHERMLDPVREALAAVWSGPARVERSEVGPEPALQGAVQAALGQARAALLSSAG